MSDDRKLYLHLILAKLAECEAYAILAGLSGVEGTYGVFIGFSHTRQMVLEELKRT